MQTIMIEAGRSYRLLRELEVRDEKTGTMRAYFLRGTVVKVKRIATEEDRLWVEGTAVPIPMAALQRMVSPVA